MSDAPAAEIECYGCRARQPAGAMQCRKCGATFRGLCVCGAEISKLDARCERCGAPISRSTTERGDSLRRRRIWAVAALAVVGAAAGGAVLIRRHLNAQPWKLVETGRRKFDAGDFAGAAKDFERATSASPDDGQTWYMLAATYRSLGMSPDAYVPAARRALERLPTHVGTLSLLADAEREAGRLDSAATYARNAVAQPGARVEDFELLVQIETSRPNPDAERVRNALAAARTRGLRSAILSVVRADLALRTCEGLPRDMFPAEVVGEFREALAAIEASRVARADARAIAAISARILTALGEDKRAADIVDRALADLPADAPATARAELLALRGRLLWQAGAREPGAAALVEALRLSPDLRLAGSLAARFSAAGQTDELADILGRAEGADPRGAVHAALAQAHFARGRLDDADAALAVALRASPDAAALLVLEGDIRAAQGRADDAAAAYVKAAQTEPDGVDGPVRLALLRVRTTTDGAARRGATDEALRDLAALEARAGRRPEISIAVAAVRLERGDAAAARAELEFVTANAPALVEGWSLLGRACVLVGDGDAAARAFRQGRRLQPDSARLAAAEGGARLAAGDASGAQAACTAFLFAHPGDADVLRVRARAARALGQWNAAADDLRRVRAEAPDDEAVLVLLAESEYRAGRREAAGSLVKASLATARPETAARLELIRAVHEEGADAAIARAAARGPSALLVEMQFRSGRLDDAIATARTLLAADAKNHAAARVLVLALVDHSGPLPERIAAARAALASLPSDAPSGIHDLLLGRIVLAEGDARAALAHLATAAAAMPSDPDARLCHGEALFRAGERDAGLAELRAAAALPDASASCAKILSSRLASAARDAPKPRTSEALAREALDVDASNTAAADVLVELLQRRGEFRAAAELAERILARPGLDAAAAQRMRRRAAVARLVAGDATSALEHVDALEKAGESTLVAAEFRGVAHLKAGRLDEAAKEFERALDGGTATPVAAVGLAETALRRGDRKGAVDVAARWRAKHPDDRDVGLAVSNMLVAQGGLDEASAVLADVVAAHPADRAATAARIDVLGRLGRPAEAVAEARRYEAAAPAADRSGARLLVAATLVHHGRAPADGLEIARAVASAADAPDDVLHEAWAVETEALLGLGRNDEAESSLARITRSWPKDAPVPAHDVRIERRVRFVRGVLAASGGRLEAASAEFRRCIAIDPLDVASQNNLAWVLCKSPDTTAEAVALTRRVTTLAPSNADYWDTRGQAARAAGDAADAEASWVRALDLFRAVAAKDGAAFGATGMRLAKLYRDSAREDAARKVAREVLERANGTPRADEARAFLGE